MDTIFNIKFEDFEKSELFSGYAYDVSNETIDYALNMLENKEDTIIEFNKNLIFNKIIERENLK